MIGEVKNRYDFNMQSSNPGYKFDWQPAFHYLSQERGLFHADMSLGARSRHHRVATQDGR